MCVVAVVVMAANVKVDRSVSAALPLSTTRIFTNPSLQQLVLTIYVH